MNIERIWSGWRAAYVTGATGELEGAGEGCLFCKLMDLEDDEADELFAAARKAVAAVKRAYDPGGFNLGANLGRAGGAGIPQHLHLHVLPRWNGDTNFMTAVAETRVLPESLPTTWQKLSEGWPQ